MKTKRDYFVYLSDMLKEISMTIEFTKGMTFNSFLTDEKTQYAVIRAIKR